MTTRISRRNLVRGIAGAGLGAAAVDAFGIEPRWLDVSHHDLPVDGLASAAEGLTIAHLTDLHLDSLGMLHEAIVENVEQAQLVVITGDAVDHPSKLPVLEAFLSSLEPSKRAVVGTRGNWEHWGEIDLLALAKAYERTGAQFLSNEHTVLEGIGLFGSDDDSVGACDLRSTIARSQQRSPTEPTARILLTHAPAVLDRVSAPPFDLALSGHTHGGQVTAFGAAVVTPHGSGRFVQGAYETRLGPAYVSRGIGTSIVPARFACRPEMPMFRLSRG